ncbi:hypothetical protein NGK36_21490 [Hafnia alvei]|uniref:hypothetical protein n=1 Tax=Hafnia alvei TaxID=569 RepID=UPI002DBB422F|nr:hypothetical protein [Hafnia alvei]MEB7891836.1 hypothetical protein [Hafnia alvei]
MNNNIKDRGWGSPERAKKAHYFREGEVISICGKWLFSGVLFDTDHENQDNCKACMKKREAEARSAECQTQQKSKT